MLVCAISVLLLESPKKRQLLKAQDTGRCGYESIKTYGDEWSLVVIDCLDFCDIAGETLAELRLRR